MSRVLSLWICLGSLSCPGISGLDSIYPFSAAPAQALQNVQDSKLRPIFVTIRVFQARIPRGSSQEMSDQVFKMRTASLSDPGRWTTTLKKVYPGCETAPLRAETRRVYRTAKQMIWTVARHPDGRSLEIRMNGAQSP